jgi:hypothetical protein
MATAMAQAMAEAVAAERAARPVACPHCHEAYDGGLGLWLETCDQVDDGAGGEVQVHFVACYGCNMTGPTAPTAELAVAAWNGLARLACAGHLVTAAAKVLEQAEPYLKAALEWASRETDAMTERQRTEYHALLATLAAVRQVRQALGNGTDGPDGTNGSGQAGR